MCVKFSGFDLRDDADRRVHDDDLVGAAPFLAMGLFRLLLHTGMPIAEQQLGR